MTATVASTSVRGSRPGDPSAVTVEGGSARPALASCPNGVLAEQLFVADYPKLARWTRRLVDDDETAHEIASEAFARLLPKWSSPDKLHSPRGYLYMIATNLVRDHRRKTERERQAMRKVTAGAQPGPSIDPAADMDVRELIAALPARLRDPFLMHYYAGLGVHEIGLRLKRPDGTIKSELHHARARLKEALAEHDGERRYTSAARSRTLTAGRTLAMDEGAA